METVQAEVAVLRRLESDLAWFQTRVNDFKKTHLNRFLAVKEGKVIADGKTLEEVLGKLKTQKQDPSEVLINFVSDMQFIF